MLPRKKIINWLKLTLLFVCQYAFLADAGNLALNASYSFSPKALYPHTVDEGDNKQLTDGKYVRSHFWTSRETVGWWNSGSIKIEIELTDVSAINTVCVNTARGVKSGVYYADSIEVFVSTDKENYHHAGSVYNGKDHGEGSYQVTKYCSATIGLEGKYVLLVIVPKGNFTFFDEIEVTSLVRGADTGAVNKAFQTGSNVFNHKELKSFVQNSHILEQERKALNNLANTFLSKAKTNQIIAKQISDVIENYNKGDASENLLDEYEAKLYQINHALLSGKFNNELLLWHQNPWQIFTGLEVPPENLSSNLTEKGLNMDVVKNGRQSNAFVLTNNTDAELSFGIGITGSTDDRPTIEIKEVVNAFAASHRIIGDGLKDITGDIAIRSGESKQIWIIAKGNDAQAGDYQLYVNVLLNNKANKITVPINIKVWPVSIENPDNLYVNAWAYADWGVAQSRQPLVINDLIDHRINVAAFAPWQLPRVKNKNCSDCATDFSVMNKLLQQHHLFTKKLFYFGFNNANNRLVNLPGEFMDARWKRAFSAWIKEWVTHLDERGISHENFAFYPVDEPDTKEEISILLTTAKLIKAVDPKIQVYTTLGKLTVLDALKAGNDVDIFQILTEDMDTAVTALLQSTGKKVWTYTATGGGKDAHPLSFYRAQAWQAFHDGANGIGFWAYGDIGNAGSSWSDFDGRRLDYSVVYIDGENIASSKRWEAWVEGVEDYLILSKLWDIVDSSEKKLFKKEIVKYLNDAESYYMLQNIRLDIFSRLSEQRQ